jgi:oligopeptidase B
VPVPIDDWFYASRIAEGQQYPVLVRRPGRVDAPEEVLLDLNEMAEGTEYFSLDGWLPSPDHRFLAYAANETGGIEGTWFVKDTRTGQTLPDRFDLTAAVEWAADSRTLFSVRQDAALRPFELWRHTLGDPTADRMLYREADENLSLWVSKTNSGAFLVAGSFGSDTSEMRFLPADRPDGGLQLLAPKRRGVLYWIDHHGDDFLVVTNDGAINFKVMTAPIADPSPANWRELIPHNPDRLIENAIPFARHLAIFGPEKGIQQVWVHEFAGGETRPVAFDEAVYSVFPYDNRRYDTDELWLDYTSLVTPSTILELDMATGERSVLDRQVVVGGYDPARYRSERIEAVAADGERVPVSLVMRADLPDGPRPLLLNGYGAYGISYPVFFDSSAISLLDRGVVVAIAHVRGGQDLGRRWYEEGRLLKKKNTFTDFVAVAEHLIDAGRTSPDRLAAQGGSAGGLLMGAVANLRPDLFRAILAHVPFVDVLRVMLDPTLPLTTGEFTEWGNPTDPVFYDYIASYSPYDNVAAQAYPNLLITGGLEDDQAPYWQPAKWTAKLRATKTDDTTLLLRMNMGAGHGGDSGRYDALREQAHDMAFLLAQLGLAAAAPDAAAPPAPVAGRSETPAAGASLVRRAPPRRRAAVPAPLPAGIAGRHRLVNTGARRTGKGPSGRR